MTKNLLIILSLVIFGWEASVPLMYFAAQGHLAMSFVLTAGVLGNVISDTMWYLVGYRITHERISRIKYFRTRPHLYQTVGGAIRKQGYLFLFCSKFLYGIGIPAHILSGAYRLPFFRTLLVNILGSLTWLLLVFGLARGAQEIPSLKEDLVVAQLVFAAFVLLMFALHFSVGKIMKKYFHLEETGKE